MNFSHRNRSLCSMDNRNHNRNNRHNFSGNSDNKIVRLDSNNSLMMQNAGNSMRSGNINRSSHNRMIHQGKLHL